MLMKKVTHSPRISMSCLSALSQKTKKNMSTAPYDGELLTEEDPILTQGIAGAQSNHLRHRNATASWLQRGQTRLTLSTPDIKTAEELNTGISIKFFHESRCILERKYVCHIRCKGLVGYHGC